MSVPIVCSPSASAKCDDLNTISFADEQDCREIVGRINTRIGRTADPNYTPSRHAVCITSRSPGNAETDSTAKIVSIQIVELEKGDDELAEDGKRVRRDGHLLTYSCSGFLSRATCQELLHVWPHSLLGVYTLRLQLVLYRSRACSHPRSLYLL